MMTILNCISLLMIAVSLLVAVFHPRIKFPIHIDIIMFIVGISAAAIFINTVLGMDMHGHLQNAEVLMRFGCACLIAIFVCNNYGSAKK